MSFTFLCQYVSFTTSKHQMLDNYLRQGFVCFNSMTQSGHCVLSVSQSTFRPYVSFKNILWLQLLWLCDCPHLFFFTYWLQAENSRAEDIVSLRWVYFAVFVFHGMVGINGSQSVAPPLWFRLEYFSSLLYMDWHEIWYWRSWSGEMMKITDFGDAVCLPLGQQDGLHFWLLVKCLVTYWIYCHEILSRYLWWPKDWLSCLVIPPTFHLLQV